MTNLQTHMLGTCPPILWSNYKINYNDQIIILWNGGLHSSILLSCCYSTCMALTPCSCWESSTSTWTYKVLHCADAFVWIVVLVKIDRILYVKLIICGFFNSQETATILRVLIWSCLEVESPWRQLAETVVVGSVYYSFPWSTITFTQRRGFNSTRHSGLHEPEGNSVGGKISCSPSFPYRLLQSMIYFHEEAPTSIFPK